MKSKLLTKFFKEYKIIQSKRNYIVLQNAEVKSVLKTV